MGLIEVLVLLVVVGFVVGPRRVASFGEQAMFNVRRVQSAVSGTPMPDAPARASSARLTSSTSATPKKPSKPLLMRLWDLSNVLGFALVAAGLAIVVADLNWFHFGPPALAAGALLLAAGTFCLAW